jgi:hypothetical protein
MSAPQAYISSSQSLPRPGHLSVATISRFGDEKISIDIPFYSHATGWRPIRRDNTSRERLQYNADRYNAAIKTLLTLYPDTEHVMVCDTYYLDQKSGLERLVSDYAWLDFMRSSHIVLGASTWFLDSSRIRPCVGFYDNLSIPEFSGRRWAYHEMLEGIRSSPSVGGCWIFPRWMWEKSDGFHIVTREEMTRLRRVNCYDASILMDFDARLWRTHETNPRISSSKVPLWRRVVNTVNDKMIEHRIYRRGTFQRMQGQSYFDPRDPKSLTITMNCVDPSWIKQ